MGRCVVRGLRRVASFRLRRDRSVRSGWCTQLSHTSPRRTVVGQLVLSIDKPLCVCRGRPPRGTLQWTYFPLPFTFTLSVFAFVVA